jgi:hypothetical protein
MARPVSSLHFAGPAFASVSLSASKRDVGGLEIWNMTIPDDKFFQARSHQTRRLRPRPVDVPHSVGRRAFNFVPGQYATLGVEVGGKRIERPYSIASSAPTEERNRILLRTGTRRCTHAASPQVAARATNYSCAKRPRGLIHARYRERTHESFAGLHGDRRGSVRQLRPHTLERLEGRPLRWHPQVVLA